jgi:predicted ATPase/class 3 adenylate cyclase
MTHALDGRVDLPTGTVTFLRTDVEGSMALARTLGARWDALNATHLDLIREAVAAEGGVTVRTEGDACFAAFQEAGAAVRSAVAAQRAIATHPWPADASIRVRMGLHTGEAHRAGDDYGGFEVNRAARIAAAGHGGQVVLSDPTRLLVESQLPAGVTVRGLGRHVLRDIPVPERLHQLDINGQQHDFPPLRTSRPATGNLPERLTSFIGRDADLAELGGLLGSSRLVTLTGPGGVGKTSLAVEAARRVVDNLADGAWFVGLDDIPEPGLVAPEIARTLGLFDGPDRPAAEGLNRYLADRSVLLVIDNFEHVLEAAGVISGILRASPATRVLVTSRAPLRVPGEQEYPVDPLAGQGVGAELFSHRARAVRPGWSPGDEAGVVQDIVALLDGLPLGLELAAARVSLLPLSVIRDRLAGRLPLPGSGPRDVPDRQRTLEATIAWSHALLEPSQQQMLEDLAVFEGSFDMEQARIVHGADVFDALAVLVEHSLVVPVSRGTGPGVRYRLLQTIRTFALARLGDGGREQIVRARHARAYLDLAEAAATHLPGRAQAKWIDRLALDLANLRSAARWAIDTGESGVALRMVGACWRFWQIGGHLAEGAELTKEALAMAGADRPTKERLAAITAAGGIAYWMGEMPRARDFYAEQLRLATELGDRVGQADARFNLAFATFMRPDANVDEALQAARAAGQSFDDVGDSVGRARTLWMEATIHMNRGGAAVALPIFEQALVEFERLGDAWYHPMALGSIGWARAMLGDRREAARSIVRSIAEYHALRDTATSTLTLQGCAIAALEAGRPVDAATLLGAYEGLSELYGVRTPLGLNWLIQQNDPVGQTQALLGPEEFADAKARGRRMSLDEAVELAIGIGRDALEIQASAPQSAQ